LKPETGYWDS